MPFSNIQFRKAIGNFHYGIKNLKPKSTNKYSKKFDYKTNTILTMIIVGILLSGFNIDNQEGVSSYKNQFGNIKKSNTNEFLGGRENVQYLNNIDHNFCFIKFNKNNGLIINKLAHLNSKGKFKIYTLIITNNTFSKSMQKVNNKQNHCIYGNIKIIKILNYY